MIASTLQHSVGNPLCLCPGGLRSATECALSALENPHGSRRHPDPPASLRKRLYRDIEIRGTQSLEDLAEAIVAAFDFDMDHAYGFFSKLTGNLNDPPLRFELFADTEGGKSRGVTSTKVTSAFPRWAPR